MLKDFLRYVLLNVFSMLGISVYVLCDTYFIANGIGTNALSGLNLVLPYFSLITALGLMIGMGTATRFSILCGAKRQEEAAYILIHGLFLAVIFSLIVSACGYIYTDKICLAMGADEILFSYAKDYIGTIFLFSWAIIINNLAVCITRATGHPRLAMIAALVGSGSNLLMDVLFIYGLKMGNYGAALASGVSPLFGLALQIYYFAAIEKKYEFKPCKIKLRKLIDICCLGFPSFITEVATGFVMACFNFAILRLAGNIGIAAYSIIANVAIVVGAMFTGVAQGIQPLISFNYGARNYCAVKQVSHYAYVTIAAMSVFEYILFYACSTDIINAFNKDNNLELISMADIGIKVYFTSLIFMGANIVMTSILSSTAKPGRSFILSICRAGVIVIPVLLLLSKYFGITGVWATIPVAEFLTLLLGIFQL